MALSDYERQMLEELEAQLADEDPSFAKTMKPASVPESVRQVSLRHLVIGMIAAVAGIALLVVGIAIPFILLGVLGVLVVFFGFWYAASSVESVVAQQASSSESSKFPSARGMSFMERQADRWNRRQES